jgi:hypothetical protein
MSRETTDHWRKLPDCPISKDQIKDALEVRKIPHTPAICEAIHKAAHDYVLMREWQDDQEKFPRQGKIKDELEKLLVASELYLSAIHNLHHVSKIEVICNASEIDTILPIVGKINTATKKALSSIEDTIKPGQIPTHARDTFILTMAGIFQNATKKKPGKPNLAQVGKLKGQYTGPFFRFINVFLSMIDGREPHNVTLKSAINNTLTFYKQTFAPISETIPLGTPTKGIKPDPTKFEITHLKITPQQKEDLRNLLSRLNTTKNPDKQK